MPGHRRRGVSAGRRQGPYRAPKPYRGLLTQPYNSTSRLTIPVITGGVNAMHPDVIDFGAAGWHGYRYWMAYTPYNGTADTEVPCIAATNDITNGGTWVVPTGYTNPITPDPAGAAHMADTDLVYDPTTDRLHVLYVTTDESSFHDIRAKWTPGDGTWSTETTVLHGALNTYVNPSVIKTATGWRIYYNIGSTGLYYRDSTTSPVSGYGSEVSAPLSLNFGFGERLFQNLNVVKDTDGSIVSVISDAGPTTVDGKLYFARSTDGGNTFVITGPPVIEAAGGTAWDSGGIYRSSLLVDTSSTVILSGSNLHLFYSAYQVGATVWGTGYAQIPTQFIRL